jgi:organic radical activating enzyme
MLNVYKNAMISCIIDANQCTIFSNKDPASGFYSHINSYIETINYALTNDIQINNISYKDSWKLYSENGDDFYNIFFKTAELKILNYPKNIKIFNDKQYDTCSHFKYSNIEYANKIINMYFNDSDFIKNKINELTNKYNIQPENTISVYYRATDKTENYPSPKLDDYISQIKIILNNNLNLNILFQSDSIDATNKFKNEFKSCIIIEELSRTNKFKGIHKLIKNEDLNKDIIILQSIVCIMAKSKYLICNCSSVSSFMILKRGNSQNVIQFQKNGKLNTEKLKLNFLESAILNKCNISCENCATASPYYSTNEYSITQFENDIKEISNYAHCEVFKLIGGEPFLLQNLENYVDIVRKYNICNRIQITTNGTLLPTYKNQSIFNKIDILFISYYPEINTKPIDEWINKNKFVCQIHKEYMNTFQKFLSYDKFLYNKTLDIFNKCQYKDNCHSLYNGKLYLCEQSIFNAKLLKHNGVKEDLDDGITIYNTNLSNFNDNYSLLRSKPLKNCSYCYGSCATSYNHKQTKISQHFPEIPINMNMQTPDLIYFIITDIFPNPVTFINQYTNTYKNKILIFTNKEIAKKLTPLYNIKNIQIVVPIIDPSINMDQWESHIQSYLTPYKNPINYTKLINDINHNIVYHRNDMTYSTYTENNQYNITCYKQKESGFYAHVVSYINNIYFALQNNIKIDNISYENAWSLYCENGNELYNIIFKTNKNKIENLYIKYPKNNSQIIYFNEHFRENNLIVANNIINTFFNNTELIENKINSIINKYNIKLDNTIAVYYRSTDKYKESKIPPLDDFITEVNTLLKENPNLQILFQSDCLTATNQFKKEFPNSIIIDELYRTKEKIGIHFILKDKELIDDVTMFHAIMSLMAQCKHIVCNISTGAVFLLAKRGYTTGVIQVEPTNVRVTKALYGTDTDNIDVTKLINSHQSSYITVNNLILAKDPRSGKHKKLKIFKNNKIAVFNDGDVLHFNDIYDLLKSDENIEKYKILFNPEITRVEVCAENEQIDITDEFKEKFKHYITFNYNTIKDRFPAKIKYLKITKSDDTISHVIDTSSYPKPSKEEIKQKLLADSILEQKVHDFVNNAGELDIYHDHIIRTLVDFTNKKCLICSRPHNGAGIYCHLNYYKKTIYLMFLNGFEVEVCGGDGFSLYKDSITDNVYEYLYTVNPNVELKKGQQTLHDMLNKIDTYTVQKYFCPSKNVTNKIDYLTKKYNITPLKFIGVVYRGTDKITECRLPDENQYIQKIKQILAIEPDLNILLQTDEQQIYDMFKTEFGNKVVSFDEIPRSTDKTNVFHVKTITNKMDKIAYFEAAMRILSKCKHVLTNVFTSVTDLLIEFRGNTENVYKIDPPSEEKKKKIQPKSGIYKAIYGTSEKNADVTDIVNSHTENYLWINNTTMQSDPAPWELKQLTLYYKNKDNLDKTKIIPEHQLLYFDILEEELLTLFNNSNSDKNTTHSYAEYYEKLFNPIKNTIKNILEIGVAGGGSLKTWKTYFKNANIYGFDISEEFLFTEDRIKTYKINSTDPKTFETFEKENPNIKFDIIIEDGDHSLDAQIKSYNILKKYINFPGIYIVEDVVNLDENKDLINKEFNGFEIIDLRHIKNRFDDVLLVKKFNNLDIHFIDYDSITNASYGKDKKIKDVTDTVSHNLNNYECCIINNFEFEADPAPWESKTLIINYKKNEIDKQIIVNEHQKIIKYSNFDKILNNNLNYDFNFNYYLNKYKENIASSVDELPLWNKYIKNIVVISKYDLNSQELENMKLLETHKNIKIQKFNAIYPQTPHPCIPSISHYGCSLSHYNVVNLAKQNNWDNVMIFEDDVIFHPQFNYYMNLIVEELKEIDWDICYGYKDNPIDEYSENLKELKYINQTSGILSTHCYIINKRSYDYIIKLYTDVYAETTPNWYNCLDYKFKNDKSLIKMIPKINLCAPICRSNSMSNLQVPYIDQLIQKNYKLNINSLESPIVNKCNLSCENCSTLSPYHKKNQYSLNQFESDIKQMSKFIHCNTFYLLGGEPFLLNNLEEYVDIVKKYNICNQISIISNGLLIPNYKNQSIFNKIDILTISYYPEQNTEKIINKWKTENLINCKIDIRDGSSFQQLLSFEKFNKNETINYYNKCGYKNQCYTLYNGNFYLCEESIFNPKLLQHKGITEDLNDGIDIYSCNSTIEFDDKYKLLKSKPLKNCSYCYGSCRTCFPS